MPTSIEIRGLSKSYRIGELQQLGSIREMLVGFLRSPFSRSRPDPEGLIWALRDVSFRAEEGEVIGIIGRNGAGKSTLLKVLSRITYPTCGTISVKGRVASLLEVGTGFHEELTGRENIYLNGSILGMRKREIDRHLDAIVEFAGIRQFIDTPIKRYSSGMRLRLGFAVAAHLDPDVLVVDEVLAVGDAGFQKKCMSVMTDLQSGGRTVLFVSHNLAAVENLCTRGIWIDAGEIRMDGSTGEVIEAYMGTFAGKGQSGRDLSKVERRLGSGEIRYTGIEYLGADEIPSKVTRSGDSVTIRFHYDAQELILNPSFGFRIYTDLGTLVTETSTWAHRIDIPKVGPGTGYIDLYIELLNLFPGRYALSLWITGPNGKPVYDGDIGATLEVEISDFYHSGRVLDGRYGIVYFPQQWRTTKC